MSVCGGSNDFNINGKASPMSSSVCLLALSYLCPVLIETPNLVIAKSSIQTCISLIVNNAARVDIDPQPQALKPL